jgi:hypothetical protein
MPQTRQLARSRRHSDYEYLAGLQQRGCVEVARRGHTQERRPGASNWSRSRGLRRCRRWRQGRCRRQRRGTYPGTAELYDPAPNAWAAVGPALGPRLGHTATLLPDGQVLVVGGTNGKGPTAAAYRYGASGDTWIAAGSLASARWLHTATPLLDGRVLVSGRPRRCRLPGCRHVVRRFHE